MPEDRCVLGVVLFGWLLLRISSFSLLINPPSPPSPFFYSSLLRSSEHKSQRSDHSHHHNYDANGGFLTET
jgi:hypothetical protein